MKNVLIIIIAAIVIATVFALWGIGWPKDVKNFTVCQYDYCFQANEMSLNKDMINCLEFEENYKKMIMCGSFIIKQN